MIALFSLLCSLTFAADLPLEKIKLPPGFKIELVARVPNARAMSLNFQTGTIYVGSREEGKVYAVARRKGITASVFTLAEGYNMPAGVAFHDGDLYFSSVDSIWKIPQPETHLSPPAKPVLVSKSFPSDPQHGWKFIAFGPDGKLYVPVGAPCNICDKGPKYANIMRMNKDGSQLEVFSEGIRNSVGFDWDPKTKQLWFTDNGRDLLGDDVPPDELNHAPKKGLHFGFPYCHAGTILDPEFGKDKKCANYTPPAQILGPHVAALGMTFYTGTMFPEKYRGSIFIAEHGSWNRSKKLGYRISFVPVVNGKAAGYETFAEGWLKGESAWGRPVDVRVDRDGALLVSDDSAGAIYRISYGAKK